MGNNTPHDMENNAPDDILNSLSNTAKQLGEFLKNVQKDLSPEQKDLLDKHMKGDFSNQMSKVQSELSNALKDINNFNSSNIK